LAGLPQAEALGIRLLARVGHCSDCCRFARAALACSRLRIRGFLGRGLRRGRLGLGGCRRLWRGFHRGRRGSDRHRLAHLLLQSGDPLVLVALELAKSRFERAQAIAILFRLTNQVRDLPFDRVEPLVEVHDGGLRGRRIVDETGGIGRTALGEDLPLHLLDLLFEPVEALLGAGRRLPLGLHRSGHQDESRAGRESGGHTIDHNTIPHAWFGLQSAAPRIARR